MLADCVGEDLYQDGIFKWRPSLHYTAIARPSDGLLAIAVYKVPRSCLQNNMSSDLCWQSFARLTRSLFAAIGERNRSRGIFHL